MATPSSRDSQTRDSLEFENLAHPSSLPLSWERDPGKRRMQKSLRILWILLELPCPILWILREEPFPPPAAPWEGCWRPGIKLSQTSHGVRQLEPDFKETGTRPSSGWSSGIIYGFGARRKTHSRNLSGALWEQRPGWVGKSGKSGKNPGNVLSLKIPGMC